MAGKYQQFFSYRSGFNAFLVHFIFLCIIFILPEFLFSFTVGAKRAPLIFLFPGVEHRDILCQLLCTD